MLVLRALGLGDFLTAVPALRILRRARPEHELVLAAPAALGDLAALSGAVDRLHPVADLDLFAAPDEPVDVAVNLHGKGPRSHEVLRAAAPREFLAFGRPEVGYAGPAWVADEHEVRRWCRLVADAWSVTGDPADLRLGDPPVASRAPGTVVIHPGAAHAARRWPVERFAEVAVWAAGRGLPVVVTGSPDERGVAERLAAGAGLPRESVLAGDTDLLGLAAVVADARLVVSGDPGVAHLASAFDTPSVVLFGPTPPSQWGPPPDGRHVVLWHGNAGGDPWGDQPDPALMDIGPAEVIEAATALLGSGSEVGG
jgi:ADP-heptose:LPS heptosyltransferase